MIRPSDSLKQGCQRAAEALRSESNRERILGTLATYGIAVAPKTPVERDRTTAREVARVGIWRERIQNGERWFVREANEPLRLWADVERIPPKGHRKRVVVFGESA